MRIEHIAFQVPEPRAFAAWYVTHLGMRIVRSTGAPTHTHFLGTAAGAVLIEVYHNPAAGVPDYPQQDPLVLHLAFVSDDPRADMDRLVAAGATRQSGPDVTPGGDTLVMLRDPWGVPVQLCRRAKPMLPGRSAVTKNKDG